MKEKNRKLLTVDKNVRPSDVAIINEIEDTNAKVDLAIEKIEAIEIPQPKEVIIPDHSVKLEEILEEVKKKEEITDLQISPELKAELKGEPGKDYILTDEDKVEIAENISVPVIEKVIEKTDVIHEVPIVREVAVCDTPIQIAEKINTLDKEIDFKVLKNVPDFNKGGKTIHRGGSRTFLDLQDAPDSYAGQAGKVVKVKTTSDGLEFGDATDTDEKVKLDQTTPQTIVNGIPKLDATAEDFSESSEIVNKDYVDTVIQEVVYTPDSLTLNTGTYVSGDVDSVKTISDGNLYIVDEVGGVPGFDIEFDFSGVESFTRVWTHLQYNGVGVTHIVQIRLWNYSTSDWDVISTFTQENHLTFYQVVVDDVNYISSGNAKLSLYHITTGNPAHSIEVDYIALAKAGMGSANDHGALTGLLDDDHPQYFNQARLDAEGFLKTETDPLSLHLDQTTSQQVINGRPDFVTGVTINGGSGMEVYYGPTNLNLKGTALVDGYLIIAGADEDGFAIYYNPTYQGWIYDTYRPSDGRRTSMFTMPEGGNMVLGGYYDNGVDKLQVSGDVYASSYKFSNGGIISQPASNYFSFNTNEGMDFQIVHSGNYPDTADINFNSLGFRFYSGIGAGGIHMRTSTQIGGEQGSGEYALAVNGWEEIRSSVPSLIMWDGSSSLVGGVQMDTINTGIIDYCINTPQIHYNLGTSPNTSYNGTFFRLDSRSGNERFQIASYTAASAHGSLYYWLDMNTENGLVDFNNINGTTMRLTDTGNVLVGTNSDETLGNRLQVLANSGSSIYGLNIYDTGATTVMGYNADNLLSITGTGDSSSTWRGRITAGGDNAKFLMGEYNSHAWIGAHNSALNAWADIYINPDGTAKTHIGAYSTAENDIITVDNNTGYTIFNAGDVFLQADSRTLYFGAGDDMSIKYDGTDGKIDTSLVNPSDLHIDCGTEKTLVLDEVVWDDIQFPIASGRVAQANFPDWDTSFTTNTGEYKFDVNDYIDLGANEMSHWWKEGTTVYPHIHIALDGANNSGSSQYVKFKLYFAYADANEVWTETSVDIEEEIPTGTADLTHLLANGASIALTNNKIGSQVKIRLKRIAATTGTEYPNHIFVTQVGIHAEKDTMGSRTISAK